MVIGKDQRTLAFICSQIAGSLLGYSRDYPSQDINAYPYSLNKFTRYLDEELQRETLVHFLELYVFVHPAYRGLDQFVQLQIKDHDANPELWHVWTGLKYYLGGQLAHDRFNAFRTDLFQNGARRIPKKYLR